MTYEPEGFGRRLTELMAEKGIENIKALQRELEKETTSRGISYTAVFQYVKGTWPTEPRREVVEGFADVFGVLPRWLLTGRGPRSKDEERAQRAARLQISGATPTDEERRWFDRYAAISVGMDGLPALGTLLSFPGGEALFQGLVVDLLESRGESLDAWAADEIEEAAYLLGALVLAPAEALWNKDPMLGPDLTLPGGGGPQYVLAMVAAIRTALPRPGRVSTGWGPRWVIEGLRSFRQAWEGKIAESEEIQDRLHRQYMNSRMEEDGGDDETA